MSHLHELANKFNGTGRRAIFAKKKVGDLRTVSKRMQAVHETSNPVLAQKLNNIRHQP